MTSKGVVWGTIIASVICFGVLLIFIERTAINIISVFGTIATLAGLFISVINIVALRTTAEAVRNAVNTSTTRLNNVLHVSQFSQAEKIIQEVQSYLNDGNLQAALIRMRDLKKIVIEASEVGKVHGQSMRIKNRGSIVTILTIDTVNIAEAIQTKNKIDIKLITENLELTANHIIQLQNTLIQRHD